MEGKEESQEGCLSVPDYFDVIQRAKNIEFRYTTLTNEAITKTIDGLLAICVQHEIDHLNGKLFIDYLSPLKRNRLKKRIHKQKIKDRRSKNSEQLDNKLSNKIL